MRAKYSFFLTLLLSLFTYAQVSSDTIFGKPKYVKEYVLFINDSGPYTFMNEDDEYGHAVIKTPKNLRSRMKDVWFTTNFCRFTNNETFYDINRKVTKEIWYYKSGDVLDEYYYNYDDTERLILEVTKNRYGEKKKTFFYEGKNDLPKFTKYQYKRKGSPLKTYHFVNNPSVFQVSKFDSIHKIDSVFAVTNTIYKKLEDSSYQSVKDSIFRQKISFVKTYNDKMQLISSKQFNYSDDYENKKIYNSSTIFYKYDERGNVVEESTVSDGNLHTYIQQKNGKYLETILPRDTPSISTVKKTFDKQNRLTKRSSSYNEKLNLETIFTFKKHLLESLSYYDDWGQKKLSNKPNLITFKYKFDKHKNWIECIKNVDGKDLYVWKREIQYH